MQSVLFDHKPSFPLRVTTHPDFHCNGLPSSFTFTIPVCTPSSRVQSCPFTSFLSLDPGSVSASCSFRSPSRVWQSPHPPPAATRGPSFYAAFLCGAGGRTFGLFPAQGAGQRCHKHSCVGPGPQGLPTGVFPERHFFGCESGV